MLKEIKKLAEKFENVENIKKEIKKVQSQKCRFRKQKERQDYDARMTEIVKYEQALIEAKLYLEPKKKFVTEFNQNDVDNLTYDETIKAIKSIQSKKFHAQFESDKSILEEAIKIEEMLLKHKESTKPLNDNVVKKSEINNLIEQLSNQNKKIDKNYILEQLNKLI